MEGSLPWAHKANCAAGRSAAEVKETSARAAAAQAAARAAAQAAAAAAAAARAAARAAAPHLVDVYVASDVQIHAVSVGDVVDRREVCTRLHVEGLVRVHDNPWHGSALALRVSRLKICFQPFEEFVRERAVGFGVPDAVAGAHLLGGVHVWAIPRLCISNCKINSRNLLKEFTTGILI